jgi:hypothetical protein
MAYTPTSAMQQEAKNAMAWKRQGKKGGTSVGLGRAKQLIQRSKLSPEIVKKMYSFFRRHEVDKQADGFYPDSKKYPSAGRVAWSLWGGDAGYKWSTQIRNKLVKE